MFSYVKLPDPVYISTDEEALYWCEYYLRGRAVGADTETTGLSRHSDFVKFFSFANKETRICGPVRLLHHFRPLLDAGGIEKRMSNAKYDLHLLANHGYRILGRIYDTVPLDWYLDENRMKHGLKDTAREFLKLRMTSFREAFPKIKKSGGEGDTVAWFHDILESGSPGRAAEALIMMRRADGDPDVIEVLQKAYLSTQAGYSLTPRQLAALARTQDLVVPAVGTHAWVSEALALIGGDVPPAERKEALDLIESDTHLAVEMHRALIAGLWGKVKVDVEPLEMLRLIVADYASMDAWASYMLVDFYREELEAIEEYDGRTILDRVESFAVPFTKTLWCMERRGFKIDAPQIAAYGKQMDKDIGLIERKVVAHAQKDVNLNSTTQLRDLFYAQLPDGTWLSPLNEPPVRWTKGGESGLRMPSTDELSLISWAERGITVAQDVLDHRELDKLNGTYFKGLPTWLDGRQRIMTDLKQAGARTGRLASSDPNLQNIPSKGDWGKPIRKLFIAGVWGDCDPLWTLDEMMDAPYPDLPADFPMTLIVADYDQLEVKIAAHESRDANMIAALRAGKDIHCETSAIITGIDYADFVAAKKAKTPTAAQEELLGIRSANKSALFGIFFGIGAVKLGGQLKLPIQRSVGRNGRTYEKCPEAQKIIDGVFTAYPGLAACIENTQEFARKHLYVQTLTGRFRRLPDFASDDKVLASAAERQAFNTLTQGGGADIVGAAMLKCERNRQLRMLGARMLLQVHDELVFEVPDSPEFIEPAKALIKVDMEHPFDEDLSVPTSVSMGVGPSWGEAKH